MQKCGQLQASIAVALMAQSAAGEAVWPADTPRRAITISNGTLCIRDTSLWCGIIRRKEGFGKANRVRYGSFSSAIVDDDYPREDAAKFRGVSVRSMEAATVDVRRAKFYRRLEAGHRRR